MTNPALLDPAATEQLIAYSELHSSDERTKFARTALLPSVVLYLASREGKADFLTALGAANARDAVLLDYAVNNRRTDLLIGIASANQSDEVADQLLRYVPRSRFDDGFESLQQLKRNVIDRRQHDPDFIAQAVDHDDPDVRDYACLYATLDQCRAVLVDERYPDQPRLTAIQRLANEPDVDQILRRRKDCSWETLTLEMATLALHTDQAKIIERLRENDYEKTQYNPAAAVAKRFASDPDQVRWFIDKRQNLGTIVENTASAEILDELRKFFIGQNYWDVHYTLRPALAELAPALAKRLPNDAELAPKLAIWTAEVVSILIKNTTSNEVLVALAKAHNGLDRNTAALLRQKTRNAEVHSALDDASMAWDERNGYPTTRSLRGGQLEQEKVIDALLSHKPEVHDAAVDALRTMSAARVRTVGAPTSPGLEL